MTLSLLRFQETQGNEGSASVSPKDPLKGEEWEGSGSSLGSCQRSVEVPMGV